MTIIGAGRMPSSLHRGFSPFSKPMPRRANPDEETTDWRAVCGRTARTVRREGRRKPSLPLSGFFSHLNGVATAAAVTLRGPS